MNCNNVFYFGICIKTNSYCRGGGGEGGDDDDLLATLEFVFAAGVLNAKEGDVITIPMLTVIVAIIKKIITDILNIINRRFSGLIS